MAGKLKQDSAATSSKTSGKPQALSSAAKRKAQKNQKETGKQRVNESASSHSEEHSATIIPTERLGFPIVGVGASAGGLEALEELLNPMPADTGMAFVVVTHQHPGHTSLLPELLRRSTALKVVEATDGLKVEPNHVYVKSPGGNLAILNGTLHRMETGAEGAFKLPIDYFFRSLALDQKEKAICIILSGTGTDGTLGLKALKGQSGMAMVEEPQAAKYSGMPASAIATGLADYILPPAAMPQQLIAYAKSPYLSDGAPVSDGHALPTEPMQKIMVLLRTRTGNDFSAYKLSTLRRRIERRMNVHQIKNSLQYVRYLHDNPHELDILFKELLIGVTNFFRDPEAWDVLLKGPLLNLLQSKPDGYTFRAWVPGCSSGEEVFSLAIALQECREKLKRHFEVQIFGTDLDADAIETARAGQYSDGIAVDVLPTRLERYFVRHDGAYRVRTDIREMAIFATQNVIKDPPFTKLDFVSCRNLLIYLNSDLQQRLLPIFHYALKPGGVLLLGPSETVGSFTDLFETLDKRWKIFRRKETLTVVHSLPVIPAQLTSHEPSKRTRLIVTPAIK
ncbi:MAG: SAM-dependent methyltransferase, partial [Planctomycetaceae bacterium]|nr:SAM-dependent methyltransferase [Planctomycetaceae bacterium]